MQFTGKHLQTYQRDGYVIVRNLFTKAEVERLYAIAVGDDVLSTKTFDRTDASGLKTKLALWFALDDSLYSKFARSARIVEVVEQLLGGPAGHFIPNSCRKNPERVEPGSGIRIMATGINTTDFFLPICSRY